MCILFWRMQSKLKLNCKKHDGVTVWIYTTRQQYKCNNPNCYNRLCFYHSFQAKWWWLAISSTSSFSEHVPYRITDLHCQGNSLVNWLSKWTIQTCARKVTERHFSHFNIKMFLFVLTVNLLQMDLKNKY